MKGYFIYQHLNKDNEIIYVGLTVNMETRQSAHKSQSSHKKEIYKIMYADAKNKTSMELYEKYYINKYNPKYNSKDARNDDVSWLKLDELSFKEYKKPKVIKNKPVTKTKKAEEIIEDKFYYTKFQLIDMYLDLISKYYHEKVASSMIIWGSKSEEDLFCDGHYNKTYVETLRYKTIFYAGSAMDNYDKTYKLEFFLDYLLEDSECKQYYDEQIKKYNIIKDDIENRIKKIGEFIKNHDIEIIGDSFLNNEPYPEKTNLSIKIRIEDVSENDLVIFKKKIIINGNKYCIFNFRKIDKDFLIFDINGIIEIDKATVNSYNYSFIEEVSKICNNKINLNLIDKIIESNKKFNKKSKKAWEENCKKELENGFEIEFFNTKTKQFYTYTFLKDEILDIYKLKYMSDGIIRLYSKSNKFYEFMLDPYAENIGKYGFSNYLLEIDSEDREEYFVTNKTYDKINNFFRYYLKIEVDYDD